MDIRKLVKHTRSLLLRSNKSDQREFVYPVKIENQDNLLLSDELLSYIRIRFSEDDASGAQVIGHLEYRSERILFTNVKPPDWSGKCYIKNPAVFASSKDIFLLLKKGEDQPV